MAQLRHSPFRDLVKMQSTIDRLFDEAFSRSQGEEAEPGVRGEWSPQADVYETKDALVFSVDLPGFQQGEIDIRVENNFLMLGGERKFVAETGNHRYLWIEKPYGKFYRRFSIPTTIDPDKITATLKNGVLEIVLPKSEKAKPKQIQISSS